MWLRPLRISTKDGVPITRAASDLEDEEGEATWPLPTMKTICMEWRLEAQALESDHLCPEPSHAPNQLCDLGSTALPFCACFLLCATEEQ